MQRRIVTLAAAAFAAAAPLVAEEAEREVLPAAPLTLEDVAVAPFCPFDAADPRRLAALKAVAGPRAPAAERPFAALQGAACGG
ncbi:hypothetical protein BCF33_0124 [Hasllibacter halocynthiae]|uniref:Uncharacterized protein n=1 Tax=Hasllibacter halocynthiae TaxID=595589 RepID=A0A2T0X6I4_9RHOB|nr:hypothetical protein [Hasllibacter halocynthiae]PRY94533.1 hypothetical protein BCF33_0124 [Hasllibacter halocynthiae]